MYWKTIYTLFATSKITNPNIKYMLFTNLGYLPVFKDIDFNIELKKLGVQVRNVEYTRKVPNKKWGSVNYVFDVIENIFKNYSYNDRFLLLDTDCIITKSLDNLFDYIG